MAALLAAILACAAALKVVELLQRGALENARAMGEYLITRLRALQSQYPVMGDVRGLGLMIGIEFVDDKGQPNGAFVHDLLDYCVEHGLILLSCGPHKQVIRFICPTIVKRDEIDKALAIFEEGMRRLTAS